ncbi:MAG TPA: HD domain-containing protein [Planctomycetaceae bacterium]|nr:HD domain-containing protein [Planctomycetaceae bacterium]
MPHHLFEIPELANLETGHGLVRIPMELDVPFTPRVRALVDTPQFQRLKHITQLGLASRVYPGATHTRFEHALGVFYNAIRYLRQLGKDPRFCEVIDRHRAEVLLCAALLHDVGHWPFCHPIEDMGLEDLPAHEEFAAHFLSADTELSRVLSSHWKVDAAEVLEVVTGRNTSSSGRLMHSILSGPIDIDKMDYLDRDSLHAGVPYGRNFDRNRLIQSLLLNEAQNGLAISTKGKTAAELMVFARYVMFSEVYWHHAVRSATSMFARAFYELRPRLELKSFFQLSEAESISRLLHAADGTRCAPILDALFGARRQLYKRVAEFSLYQVPETYRLLARRPYGYLVECAETLAEQLSETLGEAIDSTEVLIDAPPPDREIEFNVDIYFPKEGVYRPLHSVSPVVEALARTQFDDYVKRVRVFAHPRLAARISNSGAFASCLATAISETSDSR